MQMRIETFRGKEGLLRLAPAWRSLVGRLDNRRHFHCIEWYIALAETFETLNQPNGVFCHGIFVDNELVAVVPFRPMSLDVAGTQLRALQLLADAWEDETARDLIMGPIQAGNGLLQTYVQFLDQQDPGWDVISLRGIMEDSDAALALKSSPKLPFIKTAGGPWGRIELISCGPDDRPFERLSKGFRQNLRTAHNNLASKTVSFVSARRPEDLDAIYPELLKVEGSGWKGEQGSSVAKRTEVDAFLRKLIPNFGPIGGCEIHVMKIDGQAVATLFCTVVNGICYINKIGYDESFAKVSPGHLIVEYLVKTRGANGDIAIVTPYNAPPWFGSWKPDCVLEISNAFVFRPSRRGYELTEKIRATLNRMGVPYVHNQAP